MAEIVAQDLVLVGARAVGKTTVGRALAAKLDVPFEDSDERLANRVGIAAGDYLRAAGEPAFRVVEEGVVLAVLRTSGCTVRALGGGAVLSAAVRAELGRKRHFVVWLQAAPAVREARLAADPTSRPALTDLPLEDEVSALDATRGALYGEVADIVVESDRCGIEDVVARVLESFRA